MQIFEPDLGIGRAVLDACVLVLNRIMIAGGAVLATLRQVLSSLASRNVAVGDRVKV